MTGNAPQAGTDRVAERRRAVALARHYREFEGLTIQQIGDRLGRAPATVKAYFYDPTGEKARAVKARYQGVCRGCGAYTQPRNGKGDAYAYCKACHPGAIERRWSRARVTQAMVAQAMVAWELRYGRLPASYDWSPTHARRRGGEAVARLAEGEWPAASVVTRPFGTWSAARAVAAQRAGEMPREPSPASSSFGRESISLPKPRESTAKTEVLRGVGPSRNPSICRCFLQHPQISPIIRVGEVPGSNPGAPITRTPAKRGFSRFCGRSGF